MSALMLLALAGMGVVAGLLAGLLGVGGGLVLVPVLVWVMDGSGMVVLAAQKTQLPAGNVAQVRPSPPGAAASDRSALRVDHGAMAECICRWLQIAICPFQRERENTFAAAA